MNNASHIATIRNSQTRKFAEACIDSNTVAELRECLTQRAADHVDCREWKITPTQWRQAIAAAITHHSMMGRS